MRNSTPQKDNPLGRIAELEEKLDSVDSFKLKYVLIRDYGDILTF